MTICFLRRLLSRAILLTCLIPSLAHAATLNVPSAPYPTIQAGVNAANPGDTVLVADGMYTGDGNRDIDFGGKNLTVMSAHGAQSCIINCQGSSASPHRGFNFHSGETSAAIVSGLTIENGYVSSSSDYNSGSGLYITEGGGLLAYGSNPTVTNCNFIQNTVDGGIGGGMCYDGLMGASPRVTGCTFSRNTASADTDIFGDIGGGGGGGLYILLSSGMNLNITGCTFNNNIAEHGGAVEAFVLGGNGGNTVIDHCSFTGNTADGNFDPNDYGGGGIYLYTEGSIPSVTNCEFSNNTANGSGKVGGGMDIYSTGGGSPTIDRCTFTGNVAGGGTSNNGSGGGLWMTTDGIHPSVNDCTFSANEAGNIEAIDGTSEGGGLGVSSSVPLTVTGCAFTDNKVNASGDLVAFGGGIYSGNVVVASCSFLHNEAQYGCGLFGNSVSTTNSTFVGNKSDADASNGVVYADNVTATNCSFSNNIGPSTAFEATGVSAINAATVAVTNCVLWGDVYISADGKFVGSEITAADSYVVSFSDIQNYTYNPSTKTYVSSIYPGLSNIDKDPKFVNPTADLHLMQGSPCIGAGTPDGAPAVDKDGNKRPNPPSIGAYELGAGAKNSIKMLAAKMVSSHELAIYTSRNFGSGSYPVTVTATINGKFVTKTVDMTTNAVENQDPQPIMLDLAALGVPRFLRNQQFQVSVSVPSPTSNIGFSSDSGTVVIWLPTILVPGISAAGGSHFYGGDGSFPGAETHLEGSSLQYLLSNNDLGEPYHLYPTNGSYEYPTLTTLVYDRDNGNFASSATLLATTISHLEAATYANKVNIVTHSKGGPVARAYLEYKGIPSQIGNGASVNRLIMTVPVNTGSLWAKLDVTSTVLKTTFGYDPVDYKNLYPLWDAYRQYPSQSFIPFGGPNVELAALNGDDMFLPPSVQYTIIYSTAYPTPDTITIKPTVSVPGLSLPAYPYVGSVPGDFIVPYFSQMGYNYNTNAPVGPTTLIHPFEVLQQEGDGINYVNRPGLHTAKLPIQDGSYLDLASVDTEVFNEIGLGGF